MVSALCRIRLTCLGSDMTTVGLRCVTYLYRHIDEGPTRCQHAAQNTCAPTPPVQHLRLARSIAPFLAHPTADISGLRTRQCLHRRALRKGSRSLYA